MENEDFPELTGQEAIKPNEEGVYVPEPLELDLGSFEGFSDGTGDDGPEAPQPGAGTEVKPSGLAAYVSSKLGSDSIKINVGDTSLVRNVSELSEPQLLKLLDHVSQNDPNVPEIDEDEMRIIQELRKGGWEYLKQQMEAISPSSGISDDELIQAYLFQNLGEDLTDEEIAEELESFKNGPLYEKKMNNLRQQYEQYQEQVEQQALQERMQQEIGTYQELGQKILSEGFMDFDFDDDEGRETVGNAFNWVTQVDEQGMTPLDTYLSTPEGRFTASMSLATLPKLQAYVAQLHQELEQLKSAQNNVNIKPTTIVKTRNGNDAAEMEEDFDKMFPDLKLRPI